MPWANKKTILKGLCKRESYNDREVVFKLGEIFDFFATTFPLTEFTSATYSNLDTEAEGRNIPRGYGVVKGVQAVQTDTTNYTYKFNDQTVTSIDAVYDEDGATLTLNVPGYNKKLIDVSVDGDSLVIEGKPNSGNTDGFTRKFNLGDTYDADGIKASVVDGVLTLSLPYLEEIKPKKVKVKVK